MNDVELDRRLAEALEIAPRAEFTARVRQRISGARDRPGRSATWPAMGALGVLAAVAALVVVALLPDASRQASDGPPLAARTIGLPATALIAAPRPAGRVGTTAPEAAGATRRGPEVIVSPEEAAGVRLLVSAARDGHVAAAMLAPGSPSLDEELPPPDDIVVAPLGPIDSLTF